MPMTQHSNLNSANTKLPNLMLAKVTRYTVFRVHKLPLSECVLVAFLMPGLVAPSLRLITEALMSSTVA